MLYLVLMVYYHRSSWHQINEIWLITPSFISYATMSMVVWLHARLWYLNCQLNRDTQSCVKPWTHWGRVTHICASKIIIIGSDNGLARTRCQAIIWSNAGILLIRTLGTNFIEILSKVNTFWFKEMHLEMSSVKWRPFCFGLNVFTFFLFWFADQQIVPDTDASW